MTAFLWAPFVAGITVMGMMLAAFVLSLLNCMGRGSGQEDEFHKRHDDENDI